MCHQELWIVLGKLYENMETLSYNHWPCICFLISVFHSSNSMTTDTKRELIDQRDHILSKQSWEINTNQTQQQQQPQPQSQQQQQQQRWKWWNENQYVWPGFQNIDDVHVQCRRRKRRPNNDIGTQSSPVSQHQQPNCQKVSMWMASFASPLSLSKQMIATFFDVETPEGSGRLPAWSNVYRSTNPFPNPLWSGSIGVQNPQFPATFHELNSVTGARIHCLAGSWKIIQLFSGTGSCL